MPAVVVQADPPVQGDAAEEYMSLHAALGMPLLTEIAMVEGEPDGELMRKLDDNHELIDRLAYATRMTECDWGVPETPDFDTMLPQLGKVRALARTLNVDARRLARIGRGDPASRRIAGLARLARHTAEDGSRSIIEWLVANAVLNLAAECATYCAPDLDAQERGRILAELNAIDLDDIFELEAAISLDIERSQAAGQPAADAPRVRDAMETAAGRIRTAITALEGDT